MNGLLEKDFRLLLQRKQTLAVLAIIAVFMSFAAESSFIVGYFTFLVLIMTVSSISYDEFDNGYPFLMTLPITRKDYVLGKYILCIGSVTGAWLISTILYFISNTVKYGAPDSVLREMMTVLLILPIPLLLMDIMVPVQLKFGAEKSRIVIIIVGGACMAIGFLADRMFTGAGEAVGRLLAALNELPAEALVGMLFGAALVVTWISILISCHIMEKKEF